MSRIGQLATSPLLVNFAITASQAAIRPVGNFIAPICEVPDVTFRYKVYTETNRYKVPDTRRQPGDKATRIGFLSTDATGELLPNALDFPIPNVARLSDEALQFSIMEAQSTLADASALALENEIVTTAKTAALASPLTVTADFANDDNDPIAILDDRILAVKKAAKNGAPVKVLFGMTALKKFRSNAKVRGRFVVGHGKGAVGLVSPTLSDVGSLLLTNPEVACSEMVIDNGTVTEDIQFLLDDIVMIFASNSTPNRMDPSFMKTFSRMGGFFMPGSYVTEDQRDEVLKMDWITLPKVTNSVAACAVKQS